MSILASALVHDRELRALADGYAQAPDAAELYRAGRRLDDKLVSLFSFSNRIAAAVLFMRGGPSYTYANYPSLRSFGAPNRSVLAGAIADPGNIFLLDALGGASNHVISVEVAPPPEEASSLEALLLVIRVPYFDTLAAGPGSDDRPDAIVVGRNGRPVLSSVPTAFGAAQLHELVHPAVGHDAAGFREVHAGGRAWLATVRPLESTGWTIAVLSDTAALSRRVTQYQWLAHASARADPRASDLRRAGIAGGPAGAAGQAARR